MHSQVSFVLLLLPIALAGVPCQSSCEQWEGGRKAEDAISGLERVPKSTSLSDSSPPPRGGICPRPAGPDKLIMENGLGDTCKAGHT